MTSTLGAEDAVSSCVDYAMSAQGSLSPDAYVLNVYEDYSQAGAWNCVVVGTAGAGTDPVVFDGADGMAGCSYGYDETYFQCLNCG